MRPYTQVSPTTIGQRFGRFCWPTRIVGQLPFFGQLRFLANKRNHGSVSYRNQKRNRIIFLWFSFLPENNGIIYFFLVLEQARNHIIFPWFRYVPESKTEPYHIPLVPFRTGTKNGTIVFSFGSVLYRNQKRNHSIFCWFRFVPEPKMEP